MKIAYRPADERSAREFPAWQYEPPDDIYNCPPEQMEKSVRYNLNPQNNVYAMFDQQGKLIRDSLAFLASWRFINKLYIPPEPIQRARPGSCRSLGVVTRTGVIVEGMVGIGIDFFFEDLAVR